MSRRWNVCLPSYRQPTYQPDSPEDSLKDAKVTPAVMAAAHPEMVSKVRLYSTGLVRFSLKTGEIAKACNLERRQCQAILNGERRGRTNDRLVIATYLQMTMAEFDRLTRERRKIGLEWIRTRKYGVPVNKEDWVTARGTTE